MATALQANIQNALFVLSNIGFNNVLVSVNAAATTATVTFQNALAGASEPTLAAIGSLTSSTTANVTVATTTAGAGGAPIAGAAFTLTVIALDQFNQPASSYAGTVQFSTSDTYSNNGTTPKTPLLPPNYTFTASNTPGTDNGIHVFTGSVTLITAATQTVTATDTVTGSIAGSSSGVSSTPTLPPNSRCRAPAKVPVAGHFLVMTVTAEDQYGNIATSYTGTVHFTSTDSQAVLSDPSTLTNGVGSFAVLLQTAGPQTITANDKANNITGISNPTTTVAPGAL